MTDLNSENRSNDDGFTLVEVLATLTIIGLLTAIVGFGVVRSVNNARVSTTKTQISNIEGALQAYNLDNASFPSEQDGLEALVTGGYIPRLPEDAWGRPFLYKFPGENGDLDIFSYGADGEPGGEDQNADIGNWQL